MNVVLEDITPCSKRLKVEVPANRVNEEFDRVTNEFQKIARIPGFRPGKAPVKMVESRYAKEIEDELKRTFVPKVFREATSSRSLNVVSTQGIEELHVEKGQSMSFSTIIETAPDFPVPDYKSIKIEKQDGEPITDERVDEIVDRMKSQFADYKNVEPARPIQEGDFVVVDYSGTCEGKPLTDFTKGVGSLAESKGFWLRVQDDAFLPGFALQLVGSNAGDSREIKITFPEDFPKSDLQNKEAAYSVKINEIKTQVLPELTEEFCQEQFKMSVEDLRKQIRTDLETQQESETKRKNVREVLDKLKAISEFDLPDSLVKQETQRLVYDIVQENQMRGVSEDVMEENKSQILTSASENARDRVKMNFILNKIAENEKIDVSEEEFSAELQMAASRYQMTVEKLLERLQKNNSLHEIEQQILNRKTVEFLLQSATKE